MNMKDNIIALIIISLAAVSCVKKDEWPTAQQRLNETARQIFKLSVENSVKAIDFCKLFQEYLDAPDENKLLEKYTKVRKSVTMTGENSYEINYGVKFTTNGLHFGETGSRTIFNEKVEVNCVGENEWTVKALLLRASAAGERISYVVTYKEIPRSGNGVVAEITAQGVLQEKESDEIAGYSASFSTKTPLKLSGSAYTGDFLMVTQAPSGDALDEYVLKLNHTPRD